MVAPAPDRPPAAKREVKRLASPPGLRGGGGTRPGPGCALIGVTVCRQSGATPGRICRSLSDDRAALATAETAANSPSKSCPPSSPKSGRTPNNGFISYPFCGEELYGERTNNGQNSSKLCADRR